MRIIDSLMIILNGTTIGHTDLLHIQIFSPDAYADYNKANWMMYNKNTCVIVYHEKQVIFEYIHM